MQILVRTYYMPGSMLGARKGNGTYSCLEDPMDGGAWKAAVHGVAEGRTWLSDFTFTFHFHALKEMATHSSVLAWRIPRTGEPGGLPSVYGVTQSRTWLKQLSNSSSSRCKCCFHFSPQVLGSENCFPTASELCKDTPRTDTLSFP